ncbi:unnamed protein product [Clonostachys rhizophaga]|uniref:Counting factor 60 n=1 Tax=Clonostachys rhizophaga TaxID=160324 RepID=A0A9N9VBH4_9HYPO|nr:unnamed protein product [Clonostachys rhizophaga]
MALRAYSTVAVGLGLLARPTTAAVDGGWYAPTGSKVNNLTEALHGTGTYGFIFNSSHTPDDQYGVYNWCNMPHVRKQEYIKPGDEFKLQYVEVIHRHHKRTPYASNAFPVESYQWNCDEQGLYYYGAPHQGHDATRGYWQVFISPINPFVPSGWIGTCQFPQITAAGLDDSWQHGADLFGVYHDVLGFLPSKDQDYKSKVAFRVTNNVITSQVAGMVINGMWGSTEPFPLRIQAANIDSLEPQYSCSKGSSLFNSIKSNSNPQWKLHLDEAKELYATLDDISGVPANDDGFHASFDHYFDNLSARQCHDKPLPCKLVDGANSTTCVTQELANTVYRLGNWEYSQMYRDSSDSLRATSATWGVWVRELAAHLRTVIEGKDSPIYFHNIAHDGSVSRLLSILQLDAMVWPGMGSEVVFELYKKQDDSPKPTSTVIAPDCSHNNCLRQVIRESESAKALCATFTTSSVTERPTWPSNCRDADQVSSACSCVYASSVAPTATATAAPSATPSQSESGYYLRVLFGGKVFKSSNPTLGVMDMIPVETLLEYIDAVVGKDASVVKSKCDGSTPL